MRKQILVLAAAGGLMLWPGGARAETGSPVPEVPRHDAVAAPQATVAAASGCVTVTEDYTATSDLACIIVGADDVDIDLDGFTVHGPVFEAGPTSVDGVTVRNGTIDGGGVVLYGDDITLKGLTIQNGTGFVVQIGGGTIIGSVFRDNDIAVDAYWGGGIQIKRSTFVGNSFAVSVSSDSGTTIVGNRFRDNTVGVNIWDEDLFGSSNTVVRGNNFANNGIGVSLRATNAADGTQIAWNRFFKNEASGVVVQVDCAREFGRAECAARNTEIHHNLFNRNGFTPMAATGSWYPSGEPYSYTADDGLTVVAVPDPGVVEAVSVAKNIAIRNADLGIDATLANGAVIDGGRNLARRNGNPAQCVGVAC